MGQVTSNDSNQFGTGTDEFHIHIHIYIYIYIGHDSPGTSIQCKSAELRYHNFHCGRMRKKVRMPGNWNLTYSTTGSKIKPEYCGTPETGKQSKLEAESNSSLQSWHLALRTHSRHQHRLHTVLLQPGICSAACPHLFHKITPRHSMALCVCCVFDLLQEIKPAQRNRKQQEATESNGTNARSRAKAPPQNLTPGQPFPTKVRTEERSSSGYQLLQVFLRSSCGLRSSLYLKQSEDACLIHAIQTAKGQTQWVRTSETRNTINCRGQQESRKHFKIGCNRG
jgi:hypothetical protein